MKLCIDCKEEKPFADFWLKKKSKDGRDCRCGDCARLYHRNIYHNSSKRKQQIREADKRRILQLKRKRNEIYIARGGCIDCGNCDIRVLDFDHISDNKLFDISEAIKRGYSWDRIQKEIDKCDLVCANCHRIRTCERRDSAGEEAALIRR